MQVPEISVQDYLARRSEPGVVLLDVREDHEWEAGHAGEAVHVPMNSVPGVVTHEPGVLTPSAHIVVTCKMGGRSAQVTAWLNANGFDAVNLEGGMVAWAHAHQPLVAEGGDAPTIV